eukprot:Sro200_g084730.2  (411) ;mRNA; f:44880-46112
MAGYLPTPESCPEEGTYFVARGLLQPPQVLVDEIYPFVKKLREHREKNQAFWNKIEEQDTTLAGFLDLLDVSAVYFIQDLAVMQPKMKDHPVYFTKPFLMQEFCDFREELARKMKAHEEESKRQKVQSSQSWMNPQGMSYLKQILRLLRCVHAAGSVNEDEEDLKLSDEEAAFLLKEVVNPQGTDDMESTVLIVEKDNNIHPSTISPMQLLQMLPPPESQSVDPKDPDTWPKNVTPNWASGVQITNSPTLKIFTDEYFEGLGNGPALRDLEACYGPAAATKQRALQQQTTIKNWRSQDPKKKTWCKRKAIYAFIEKQGSAQVARKSLAAVLQEGKWGLKIPNGMTASEPGSSTVNKLIKLFAEHEPGAKERSQKAVKRSQKAKENKEAKKRKKADESAAAAAAAADETNR